MNRNNDTLKYTLTKCSTDIDEIDDYEESDEL